MLDGATQVILGAVLAYDLHFKINFVLKLGVQGFFTPAGNWCYCMCINISATPFPLPSSVCKGGFK